MPPGELSGFRLVSSGAEALQLRLMLIERATQSIDLQVYQFKGDATGRALMRALRDAAARGVRVRLLLDDLYTAGDDALWLGLAATPGIEVRLFNPFLAGRDSHLSRLVESALGQRAHAPPHAQQAARWPTARWRWPAAATSPTPTSCRRRRAPSSTSTCWWPARWCRR